MSLLSAVLDSLQVCPRTPAELQRHHGCNDAQLRTAIYRLRKKGYNIEQDGHRRPYRLAEGTAKPRAFARTVEREIFINVLRCGVWTTKELADGFGVSGKTVCAIARQLIADGWPIVNLGGTNRGARYTIGHGQRQFPAGRVCAHPGCHTTLNRFHEGPLCYTHEGYLPESLIGAMLWAMLEDVGA
jgi:biotin operon repressor